MAQIYEETQTQIFAGTDTTGITMMCGTFHLLRSPQAYQRLKNELCTAWVDPSENPTPDSLEKLPYLVSPWAHHCYNPCVANVDHCQERRDQGIT